jgi:SPP1 gp7 family putative phage head morphogenesis protein
MPSDFTKLAVLLAGHVDDLQRLALSWSQEVAFLFSEKDRELVILSEMMAQDFGQPTLSAENSRKLARVRELIISLRDDGQTKAVEFLQKQLDSLVRNEDKFNRAWLLALFVFLGKPKPKLKPLTEEQYSGIRKYGMFGDKAIAEIFDKVALADSDRVYSIVTKRIYGQIDAKQMRVALDKALATSQYQVILNSTMIVNGASNDTAKAVAARNDDISDGLMWVTEMDERVCRDCDTLEGEVFAIGDAPGCPLHPNCRCHLVPVTMAFAEEIKQTIKASGGAQ